MALPLDGALYISNPRRTATSSPDVLNGLGDLMAITISNPLLMNRMTKRQARAHAKSMRRSKSGRFLPRRKAAKRRARKLTTARRAKKTMSARELQKLARRHGFVIPKVRKARRGAARSRAKRMTTAQLEAMIRRYGYTGDVRRRKTRKLSDEQKAKMQAGRRAQIAKRKERYGGDAAALDVWSQPVQSRSAVVAYGKEAGLIPNRRRNRRNRRNGRRNPVGFRPFDMIENFVSRVPVIGGLAPYVGPALVGATVGAVHYYAVKQVIGPAIEMLNPSFGVVKTVAERGAYTIGGATVAGVLHIPMVQDLLSRVGIKPVFQTQLAIGALLVGGALDVYRYLKGDAATAYGDGMAYKVVPFGGLSYGTIEGGLDYGRVHTATRSNPIIMGRSNPIEMGGLSYGNPVDMGGLSYGSPSLNGIVYAGEGM